MTAGGMTSIVVKSGDKIKSVSMPPMAKKVAKKEDKKEEETAETPKANGTKKDKDIVEKVSNAIEKKVNKIVAKKAGKDDDTDDPIAQSLKMREKYGGVTS